MSRVDVTFFEEEAVFWVKTFRSNLRVRVEYVFSIFEEEIIIEGYAERIVWN